MKTQNTQGVFDISLDEIVTGIISSNPIQSIPEKDDQFLKALMKELPMLKQWAAHYYRFDVHEQQDLVQETLTKAWQARNNFVPDGPKGLMKWLGRIMRNHFINEYRRRGRWSGIKSIDFDPVHDKGKCDPSDFSGKAHRLKGDAYERFEKGTSLAHIYQGIIQAVPDCNLRYPFLLVYIEGLRYDQIAAIVDIPIGTVKNRIHRAKCAVIKAGKEHPEWFL